MSDPAVPFARRALRTAGPRSLPLRRAPLAIGYRPQRDLLRSDLIFAAVASLGPDPRALQPHLTSEVLRRAARWPTARIAANFFPADFADPAFAGALRGRAAMLGVDPARIEVEMVGTQRIPYALVEQTRLTVLALRRHGFGVVLDDFGTGYADWERVRGYAWTKIKIGRSTVARGMTDEDGRLRTIVSEMRARGFSVLAQGLTTDEGLAFARRVGCDSADGDLVGRLLAPDVWESIRPGLLKSAPDCDGADATVGA